MKNEAIKRVLLLVKYLYLYSDENSPISGSDILAFWQTQGIQSSRKSVYSDISLLVELGMDIVCVKSTQNRYFVGSRLFELPELKLLVDAVESSCFITKKKSRDLIHKLAALTSEAQAVELDRPVYLDGVAKPDNEAVYYIMDALHTAMREKKKARFQYYEYTPKKEKVLKHGGLWYVFSPYALLWNRDFYYAVGYSERHGKIAQFRVDRMTGVTLLEESAAPDPTFRAADYVRTVFGMYGAAVTTVELLCENETMRSVVDRFGEEVRTETVDDLRFRATVEVAASPPFFAWVFTFGGKIKITGPAETLAEMRSMAVWLTDSGG